MSLFHHLNVTLGRRGLSRRSFLHQVSAGAAALGSLNFVDLLSVQAEELRRQGRAMILLYMQGGPSQLETFDPKPVQANGGPTQAIDTAVPGIRIAQAWPKTAQVLKDVALIRSLTNKEGNHQRAMYQMHTGYVPAGSVKHPSLGACIAKELTDPKLELPAVVSISGPTQSAGFLGVDYEPFVVANAGEMPRNAAPTTDVARFDRRLGLLGRLQDEFAARGGARAVADQRILYDKASRMVKSAELKAFDLASEPAELRQAYGETRFGRGCLLARRLVEAGVTFVEVKLNGWDTHDNNFERTTTLAGEADPALAALVTDLKQKGLLEKTVVLWTGEFGRTPRINPRTGRDHYPRAFSALVAGGGLKGGQVVGATTDDGMAVADQPVSVADLFSTVVSALKLDPRKENLSPLGRPLKIVDGGTPIAQLMG